MPATITTRSECRDTLVDLFQQAQAADFDDHRFDERYPMFRHVTVAIQDGSRFSAITCEISMSGLGLLHRMPLTPGRVMLILHGESEWGESLPSEIVWCAPCGGGWFMSAARFVEESALTDVLARSLREWE